MPRGLMLPRPVIIWVFYRWNYVPTLKVIIPVICTWFRFPQPENQGSH